MSLVGEAAGAFTGGADAALQEQRRQELLQSVLARFKGQGAAPRAFNFSAPQGGAFEQNPIATQPPIVPTDTRLQTTQDNAGAASQTASLLEAPIPGPPQLPTGAPAEMPTAPPPDAGAPSMMDRFSNMVAAPSGPAGRVPGLAPQEISQPADAGLPQMDDVNEWRTAWQDAARTHQASAYTDLRRMGFDDKEVFGILGGWRELPSTVVEKLARMGQTSVPAYATGTETPDAVREKQLSQHNAQYGARGMDPSLGGKFGDPESYAQNQFQYATGGMFDPRYDRSGRGSGGGGTTKYAMDAEWSALNTTFDKMASAAVPGILQEDYLRRVDIARTMRGYMLDNGVERLTAKAVEIPEWAEVLRDPSLGSRILRQGEILPRALNGGGGRQAPAPASAPRQYSPAGEYSEEVTGPGELPQGMEQQEVVEPPVDQMNQEVAPPALPPGKRLPGEKRAGRKVAPAGAPADIRKHWAELTDAEASTLEKGAAKHGWARVSGTQEYVSALKRVQKATANRGK